MSARRGYHTLGRREVTLGAAAALVGCATRSPSGHGSASLRPTITDGGATSRPGAALLAAGTPEPLWGIQSGPVDETRAVVWCRSDRRAKMVVEWTASATFGADVVRVDGPIVDESSDWTGKIVLEGLPRAPARPIRYRVRFEAERPSPWLEGELRMPPPADAAPRDVRFAWSGDVCGQGFGIDPSRGGMPAFTALLERAPELFVSAGDAIYADVPIPPEIPLLDGTTWKNFVTPAKSHVAETLDDFRGAHLYGRHSAEVRALSARVPYVGIWDDHEVRNNWFPGEVLDDDRWQERSIDVLAERARRAMLEYAPVLDQPELYRSLRWGPLLEIFFLDGRTFRTPNEPAPGAEAYLGERQLAWLEAGLLGSTAAWKVVVCDMPIGLVVAEPARSGKGFAFDGIANEGGRPRGRELEFARLFAALARRRVSNVIWLTADVHYAAAHRYDPKRAAHASRLEMRPFWEFIAGPMHALAFPRKPFDDTFGPELVYAGNHTLGPPSDRHTQSFGLVDIDARTRALTVTLVDGAGRDLHVTRLPYES